MADTRDTPDLLRPVAYRISDPGEPEFGHWLSEEPAPPGWKSEPLYTAQQPAPAADGWLPIETAPKDRTEILGHTTSCGALILYWDEASDACGHWSDGMSRYHRAPTHWRPLPAPPSQDASKGGGHG